MLPLSPPADILIIGFSIISPLLLFYIVVCSHFMIVTDLVILPFLRPVLQL